MYQGYSRSVCALRDWLMPGWSCQALSCKHAFQETCIQNLAPADAFLVRGGVPSRMYDLVNIRNGFFDDVPVPPQGLACRSRSLEAELSAYDRRRLARSRPSEWFCPSGADYA